MTKVSSLPPYSQLVYIGLGHSRKVKGMMRLGHTSISLLVFGFFAATISGAASESRWTGTVSCPSSFPLSVTLSIDDNGAVTGQAGNMRITAGQMRGTAIEFSGRGASATGRVTGGHMSGNFPISRGHGSSCTWTASLVGQTASKKAKQRDERTDPRDNNQCLSEVWRRHENKYADYKIKLVNRCKKSIHIVYTNCNSFNGKNGKMTCVWSPGYVSSLSTEVFSSRKQYPEWRLK